MSFVWNSLKTFIHEIWHTWLCSREGDVNNIRNMKVACTMQTPSVKMFGIEVFKKPRNPRNPRGNRDPGAQGHWD